MTHRNFHLPLAGLVITLLLGVPGLAQRQLVLVSRDEVVLRFREGDRFHTKLDNQRLEHWGFVVEINEFSLITSQDTIPLRRIHKVLLPGKPLIYKIGKILVGVGVGYFLIDQLNYTLVQHNDPGLDPYVWKPAVIMASAGLPLMLFRKKWKKISKGVKLISVGRDSNFYLSEY